MATGVWTGLWDTRAQQLDKYDQIVAAAKDQGRAMTDEEHTAASDILAQVDKIDRDIDLHEKASRAGERNGDTPRQAIPMAHIPVVSAVRDRVLDKPWGFDTFGMSFEQFMAKTPTYHIPEGHALHPGTRYQNAADGEFLKAVFMAHKGYRADPRLLYQEYEAAAQGAGEFIGADSGFVLPKPSADRLVMRMAGGEILSRVQRDILTIGNSIEINVINETNRATGSRHGAVQGYWVDEGTAPTASRPKFAKLDFKLKKLAALGYASDELLQDVSLMGRLVFDAFADELRFLTEDAIINGTGTGTPQGLLNAQALVSVPKETGQAATTLLFENIVKMWSRCYAPCRKNCIWLTNQNTEPQLYSMALSVGTGGVPVFLPPSGLSGQPYATLFGRPVIPCEYAAGLGTVGDIILTDLGEYWFFDKGDPQQASSIHVAFTTDEQAFRVTYRVDGRCSWIDKLTPFKGTASTQSCCVVVATRA